MTLDLDAVVEVILQAVFQGDDAASFDRFCHDSDFEKTFVDKLVVVGRIFLACVKEIHLEGEQRELELASDEGKGFGRVLLAQLGSRFPTAFGERVLQVLCLNDMLARVKSTRW
jgi:hypothetical protein